MEGLLNTRLWKKSR